MVIPPNKLPEHSVAVVVLCVLKLHDAGVAYILYGDELLPEDFATEMLSEGHMREYHLHGHAVRGNDDTISR